MATTPEVSSGGAVEIKPPSDLPALKAGELAGDNSSTDGSPSAPAKPPVYTESWARRHKKWIVGIVLGALALAWGLGLGLGLGLNGTGSKKSTTTVPVGGFTPGQNSATLLIDPTLLTFYVGADQVNWAYAGSVNGSNSCADPALSKVAPPAHALPNTDGAVFVKAQYRPYADETFSTVLDRPEGQEHLGILGPLFYVEAGQTIQIVFRNNLPDMSVNMEPIGGLFWSTPAPGFLPPVAPGETVVYRWTAPDLANSTMNSRLFLYHSSVNPTGHDNAGLVGPIIVVARGQMQPDGSAQGVDRDIVTVFHGMNELVSPYTFVNAQAVPEGTYTKKMTVNGMTYCNLPGLTAAQGEKVRWHVGSLGGQDASHNFHWHAATFLTASGRRVDQVNLVGSNTASLDMSTDTPVGTWLFHCHLNAHMHEGMQALFTINPVSNPPAAPALGGVTRQYYIQAEEVLWSYAPDNGSMCSGALEPFNEDALVFLGPPDASIYRIGSVYIKAQYKQYTDATFTEEVPRPAEEAYMGLLGPTLRVTVGDTLKVTFRNKLRYYASIHPHGVRYDKANEGAGYSDNTTLHDDDLVAPNATYTYTWTVPERAGPGPSDPSSLAWLYHSHVDEAADTSAGLVGMIVVNRKGSVPANATAPDGIGAGLPSDVDKEAFYWFHVIDEVASRYWKDNIVRFLPKFGVSAGEMEELTENEEFGESSLKHSINGLMFCNGAQASFQAWDRVRFHVVSMGSQEDVHSPHIEGGVFVNPGMHGSTIGQLAGTMMTSDVVFTAPGQFHIECRVTDHIVSGMELLYNVAPGTAPAAITGGKTRQFFLGAEEKTWDYAPLGYVKCTNNDLSADKQYMLTAGPDTIGSKRPKAIFEAYSDATFTTELERSESHEFWGVMGPVLAAEVGDTVEVTLKNKLSFPISFSPGGALVPLHNVSAGASVEPNATFTYRYLVPAQAGPQSGDLSSTALLYASDVDFPAHTAAGLVGVMILTAQGGLKPDGLTPKDVDMLLPLHYQVFNEMLSPTWEQQLSAINASNLDFVRDEDNQMASINGYMFCNMPSPEVPLGSRVRMVFTSLGSEEALFSPRVQGQRLSGSSGNLQSEFLLAAMSMTADLVAEAPGVWPIVDDVHEHLDGGMIATVIVTDSSAAAGTGGARKLLARARA